MSTDSIILRDLRIVTICGALPEEKVRAQPFRFDVELQADLAEAGASDDLDHTINYGELTDRIVETISTSEYTLIERMAQVVADIALSYERAIAVTVEVSKMRPPVAHALEQSAVRITRRR